MDEKTKELLYRVLPDKFLGKIIEMSNEAFNREKKREEGEAMVTSAFAVCSKDGKYYDTGVIDTVHTGSYSELVTDTEVLSLIDVVREKCRVDGADTKAVFLVGEGAKRFKFNPSNILEMINREIRVVCRSRKKRYMLDAPDYIEMDCLTLDESVYSKDFGDKILEHIRKREYGKATAMLEQLKEREKEAPFVVMSSYLLKK